MNPSNADANTFVILRRAAAPSDTQWGAEVAPTIAQPTTDQGLNINESRLLIRAPEGTAGLIPGNGATCFVSHTAVLGTVTSCSEAGWASAHGGWDIVGTIGGKTIVQGVVPDRIDRVVFGFSTGPPTTVTLNANHAYSGELTTEPVTRATYAGGVLVERTPFGSGTAGTYFGQ